MLAFTWTPNRTAGDVCPYRKKPRVYILTNFKALWARRGEASHISKERCGVRDTAASVPATFLLLFSSPEKRRYSTQPRTPVPTVRKLSFRYILITFKKSLLCFAREVASSVSEKTVGSFCGRTQFIPTALLFLCINPVGETCGPLPLNCNIVLHNAKARCRSPL